MGSLQAKFDAKSLPIGNSAHRSIIQLAQSASNCSNLTLQALRKYRGPEIKVQNLLEQWVTE